MASRIRNVRSENIDDHVDQPLHKRLKQWSASSLSLDNSILNEPGPLGLSLKKSNSFLEILQMMISQGNMVSAYEKDETSNSRSRSKKESRASAVKLKASNFPAILLKIGSWEYKSKFEGELVAKCYYATEKLVWEVLEGDLKRKIEIPWSNITALQANCPEEGPSTLTLVVARQPRFFREADPLPRKSTRWESTTDFTGGQASIHRMHFLQCEQGLLAKHFAKLIQCSSHLNLLSRQPEIILDSPYFGTQFAAFEKPDNSKGSATTHFQNTGSPHLSLSPSFTIEHSDPSAITLDSVPCKAPSSSPEGIYCSEADSRGPSNLDQIKQPGLHLSNSQNDLVGFIEHELPEEIMDSENPSFSVEMDVRITLDDVEHDLLSDDIVVTLASNDSSLISKVKSFGNVLDLDPAEVLNPPDIGHEENIELGDDLESNEGNKIETDIEAAAEEDSRDFYGGNPTSGMSRNDSFLGVVLHLPKIASLPKIPSLPKIASFSLIAPLSSPYDYDYGYEFRMFE
ncbi:uncharacterized protein LOC123905461 isoform X1 [Trifolium pratense]|uniref:uncharacterized protein LOC123905461 isoform X1 n=2 Tax=Trifolium pratense TaxID=57577 RepID=UPI001E693DAB|nr:uncharacterized protein LOC123905461 isoform X1 [Trifolium pratense]